ncbi:TonB-dependent receptor plug domain-containing protein [Chitinophaga filiformis]|uniref:TonB-dependent outer membrane receptor, SusC/RagA subfamily, signature region n=1 Tax=Chitinophaga filiformis TaxID=104663 RepID=A0A1G7S2K5_CHIFI|nr:TonB-dependent receptor plug domain-containing protein [Chitinophaga filiformis]SDG17191.1 TonB-dependent outer membrane receptor, SusC/RagA subfamily, signature region [Chitinophaga filiformis]
MKHYIKAYALLVMFLLAFTGKGTAQLAAYNDNKEKIYIQTNHVFFKPGDDLFFKVYLVNAKNQLASVISSVVYVEIVGPSGSVLAKLNYRIDDGYAEGHYEFGQSATGGLYKIRAYTTWMRNEKESTWFTKEITLQKVIAPRVMMKLDFPRKGYGPGDEVIAAYSIRDLSNKAIPNYEIKYTVSLGGKSIENAKAKTDAEGKANISFKLPADLNTNDGMLNITVNYGAYTEAISRSIPIALNKIDLQFMPEGGTFIENIPTNIAFKAINEYGKPADVHGEVLDDLGNVAATFTSYHDGMGQFSFTPQAGKIYSARIISPSGIKQPFDLPAAAKKGIVMNIDRKEKLLQFKLSATQDMKIRLTGRSKDDVYYRQEISLKKGEQLIDVDPSDFPAGIARFTITNEQRIPLAERILFLHPNRILQVKITADKSQYLPREKVTLHLKTLDENGKPIPSNFSLSVIDDKLWSLADDKQDHILSWLLMSSELHGKIEEPQFYFKQEEKAAIPSLDLVMLTHGYRYFDYIDYIEKTGKPKYNPDLNNVLSGVILDKNGQPVKSTVYLISGTDTHIYTSGNAVQHNTGDDGLFFFTDITPALNYHLIARATHKKEPVTIRILEQGTGYAPMPARKTRDPFDNDDRLPPPLLALNEIAKPAETPKDRELDKFDKPFPDGDEKRLQEVVVIGFGTQKKEVLAGAVAQVKQEQIIAADPFTQLQGRVAGIAITPATGAGANGANIKIRGINSVSGADQPLYVLNGIPIRNLDDITNINDIESIYVLKGADATAIYGSRGAHGVILVTTRDAKTPKTVINLDRTYYYASQSVQAKNNAYTVARRFYAPKYYSPETKERDDFRETIYWNPVVQTNKNGDAEIEFYNSDATTTFRAIAEGIGYNGKLGRTEMTYAVQPPMSIDAKIPPYMTIGDNALIPLVIRNSSSRAMSADISAVVPDNMVVGNYNNAVSILPDSATQVLIPVKATAAVTGDIKFVVSTETGTEKISLPISVNSNGFPVITTISGNKSATTSFTLGNMMAGSLATELKVFNDLEGQLLNDIESMLREPYGCFEQTSSSTYPNIYILKYLRSANKSNPAIEKKALKYIRDGYQRLIGFETAENGFEWFGKTPAHEALTAYGLLEFTDMQEFVHVDSRMLNRTKEFLLSRRDGKGTFNIVKNGYDAFASVPDKIANIYIVYALTQAGIGNEIELEYETAVKQALNSKDAYQQAMMAIAASNMKNEKDYAQLMTALQETKLQSETSVTNSRAQSLKVETMALYAIALTRAKSPDLAAIANVISRILGEKTYYGYGSTQATILALQAIVEYRKLTGEMAAASKIEIKVNNESTLAGKNIITNIKEGDNTFSVKYASEKDGVPYQLELAYYTLLPPDNPEAELKLATHLSANTAKVGETVRLQVEVKNIKDYLQPMSIAKIGIPAGLTVQPWQLKEIMEKNQVAYYEIFDNYLVLYWMGFAAGETKQVNLDLKAEIAGKYRGRASTTYLYYMPEYKHWNPGTEITIAQ